MQKSEQNTFEHIVRIPIDINTFQPGVNTVLLEYDPHENDKTKSGIFVPRDGRNYAQNAIRISKLVKNPICLYYNKKGLFDFTDNTSMLWKTEIETLPGDLVLTNHLDSNNAYQYECDGKVYRTINYGSIEAVKRSGKIIPVNGNILVKPVVYEEKILDYSVKKERHSIFEVCHVGKRNLDYGRYIYKDPASPMDIRLAKFRSDFEDEIKPGDKVIITEDMVRYIRELEADVHAKFDDGNLYKVCKRYMIGGIIE